MTSTITDPTLLQCSRVNVLDVRPVLESGKEPFDSIQYSLSSLEENSSLLVVAPFEPRPLKKYVERQDFSFVHEEIAPRMHWLVVYSGAIDHEIDISGPAPSYVLPAGNSHHVGYLDCRELAPAAITECVDSTLAGLSRDDLLVVHSSSWDSSYEDELEAGAVLRKSIISDNVRVELAVEGSRVNN